MPGPASLSRNKHRGLCNQAKNVECSKCIKKFKTVKGRDKHYFQFHTEGARTWEYPREKCTTQLNSLNAYHNHQLWHNGMTSQIRRRIARERRKQQARLKAYARHINSKGPKVHGLVIQTTVLLPQNLHQLKSFLLGCPIGGTKVKKIDIL